MHLSLSKKKKTLLFLPLCHNVQEVTQLVNCELIQNLNVIPNSLPALRTQKGTKIFFNWINEILANQL